LDTAWSDAKPVEVDAAADRTDAADLSIADTRYAEESFRRELLPELSIDSDAPEIADSDSAVDLSHDLGLDGPTELPTELQPDTLPELVPEIGQDENDGSDVCTPQCEGQECGADGCGGECGTCLGPQDACLDGKCMCQPYCSDKECGDDGCGGQCGACAEHFQCVEGSCAFQPYCGDGSCDVVLGEDCGTCLPDCGCGEFEKCFEGSCCAPDDCQTLNAECGMWPDGCGGSFDCGSCTELSNSFCSVEGTCDCMPDCAEKQCGDDDCGGDCGKCLGEQQECYNHKCVCMPACADKQCGPDGCGNYCGWCEWYETCTDGACTCAPDCVGRECGFDGCWGSCGECGPWEKCGLEGTCICSSQIECAGACCPIDSVCWENQCCVPTCLAEGGADGCGGTCLPWEDLTLELGILWVGHFSIPQTTWLDVGIPPEDYGPHLSVSANSVGFSCVAVYVQDNEVPDAFHVVKNGAKLSIEAADSVCVDGWFECAVLNSCLSCDKTFIANLTSSALSLEPGTYTITLTCPKSAVGLIPPWCLSATYCNEKKEFVLSIQ